MFSSKHQHPPFFFPLNFVGNLVRSPIFLSTLSSPVPARKMLYMDSHLTLIYSIVERLAQRAPVRIDRRRSSPNCVSQAHAIDLDTFQIHPCNNFTTSNQTFFSKTSCLRRKSGLSHSSVLCNSILGRFQSPLLQYS